MNPLTQLPSIPSDQIIPLVAELLGTIQLQMEEIQPLKDKIASLKGQKPSKNYNIYAEDSIFKNAPLLAVGCRAWWCQMDFNSMKN